MEAFFLMFIVAVIYLTAMKTMARQITRVEKKRQLKEKVAAVGTETYWHDDWNKRWVELGQTPILTEDEQEALKKKVIEQTPTAEKVIELLATPPNQRAGQLLLDHAYACAKCRVEPNGIACNVHIDGKCPDWKTMARINKEAGAGWKVAVCPACDKYFSSRVTGFCPSCNEIAVNASPKATERNAKASSPTTPTAGYEDLWYQ